MLKSKKSKGVTQKKGAHCPVPKIGWLSTTCRSTFLSLNPEGLVSSIGSRELTYYIHSTTDSTVTLGNQNVMPPLIRKSIVVHNGSAHSTRSLCSGPDAFSCLSFEASSSATDLISIENSWMARRRFFTFI